MRSSVGFVDMVAVGESERGGVGVAAVEERERGERS